MAGVVAKTFFGALPVICACVGVRGIAGASYPGSIDCWQPQCRPVQFWATRDIRDCQRPGMTHAKSSYTLVERTGRSRASHPASISGPASSYGWLARDHQMVPSLF